MAKNKRKISSTQRDKSVIEVAKKLKAAGILSKKANLHSGRYVSRGVLKKVIEKQHLAHLNYQAVKVPKELAKAAKERGFEVVGGNKIVGPKDGMFSRRLKAGELTGVKPVKGGYFEEVVLPYSVFDMKSLVHQLELGIDSYKLPNEQFAFKFHGHESYKAFMNTEQMLTYLRGYKTLFDPGGSLKPEELTEEFQNLVILRLHPNDTRRLIPSKERRKKMGRTNATGRNTGRAGKTLSERLAAMHPRRAEAVRKKRAERAQKQREEMAKDPKKLEAYRAAARKRAHKSYHGE